MKNVKLSRKSYLKHSVGNLYVYTMLILNKHVDIYVLVVIILY